MYIKVDYSIERKSPQGYAYMPGEYAIYTKRHWWQRWKQESTFADLSYAIREAERMAKVKLPKYFR